MDILGIVLRWTHIFAAMTLIGGLVYQRFAFNPAAATFADPRRTELIEAARRRWSKVVMICVLFLLISGLVNFFVTHRFFKSLSEPQQLPSSYNMLFGIKFLLAMVVFSLASVLAGRSSATETFRDNANRWLTVALAVAALLVAVSGSLRSMHTGPNVEAVARSQ